MTARKKKTPKRKNKTVRKKRKPYIAVTARQVGDVLSHATQMRLDNIRGLLEGKTGKLMPLLNKTDTQKQLDRIEDTLHNVLKRQDNILENYMLLRNTLTLREEAMPRAFPFKHKVPEGTYSSASLISDQIYAERVRQIRKEHHGTEHDDTYVKGELAQAAATYALNAAYTTQGLDKDTAAILWPWELAWWKPKDTRRDLIRAGALIVAEIERLDRSQQ